MSLSVKENRFMAINRLGENMLQTVLQGKVDLSAEKDPIGRVVWMKGEATVESFAVDQDRVYVQGEIDLSMVYEPETLGDEEAGLQRVEWPGALPFDHYVELIGAKPKMDAEVSVDILVCEWDLKSSQYSLDVDVILATKIQVYQQQGYSVIGDVNMAAPVKVNVDGLSLSPLLPVLKFPVKKEVTEMLDAEEDNPVKSVLDTSASLQIKETIIESGKAIIKGTADLNILCELADFSVQAITFENVLPFDIVVESEKIEEGMHLCNRLFSRCESFAVNDGKNIRVELKLSGSLNFEKQQIIQVLTDITTPGNQVEVRKELVGVDSFICAKTEQGIARGLVESGQQMPPIRELLDATAVAYLLDYEVEEDKLVIDGVLDITITYLAHSEEDVKPVYRGVFPEAIPFHHAMALSGLEPGMQPRIELEVSQVRSDLINRETVEVSVTVASRVKVVEYLEIELAVEAVEVKEPMENPPSLTFVFVQSGDTIWKLAKQYHSTEEAILEANPSLQGDPASLKPGVKIHIPLS
ncbi:MAG TPA: DUF3794 domain-containing protein [Natronincola sp.]|nr:DUF3794 domain-containing protein [Natronincola sp.]